MAELQARLDFVSHYRDELLKLLSSIQLFVALSKTESVDNYFATAIKEPFELLLKEVSIKDFYNKNGRLPCGINMTDIKVELNRPLPINEKENA